MKYLLLALLATSTAYANEGGTEFWYQAGAGTQDVTVTLSNTTTKAEYTGSETNTDETAVAVEYEYGYDEHRSMGVQVTYGTGTEEAGTSENDKAGLHDIELFYKANHAMDSGNLRYGAALEVSPGDAETDSSGDENNYSGGMALIPYVGWEQSQDACAWGARLSREFELAAKKFDNKQTSSTGETEGGEATMLSGFYEHKFDESMRLGVALNYITYEDTETGSTTTEALSPIWRLDAYLPIAMGEGTLLPRLEYSTSSDDKAGGTNLDGYTGMKLAVGYRMMF